MRNLISPNWDDINNYVLITNSKRNPKKTCLLNLKNVIISCYDDYFYKAITMELHHLSPHFTPLLNPTEENEKNCLLHCYNSYTKHLGEMKIKILKTQDTDVMSKCQYCGIDTPNSFDHYAPKGKFPEFCVYAKNLIPCCKECNSIKLDTWTLNGSRKIINFYFDIIPNKIYLYANITYDNDIPIASFELKNDDSNNLYFFNLTICKQEISKL